MALRDIVPHWGGKTPSAPAKLTEPEELFETMRREMDRVFSEFRRGFEVAPIGAPWGRGLMELSPRTDFAEDDQAYEVTVEVPGLEEKDIEVSIGSGLLTIKGEKKAEREDRKQGYHLAERSYGTFQRTLSVPPNVALDRIEAKVQNGVLRLTMPKSGEGEIGMKRIKVERA